VRKLHGKQIGSNKNKFQKWDILFAKIMPSLENKKITLVAEDISNALASTEFIVLRRKPEVNINLFYLFRALRADHFTQQAVANVTGDTGRQRINPRKLLELRILVPPLELEEKIGRAVEHEFTLHALSIEQTNRVDDETEPILGQTTLRISKASSRASTRKKR
jgi:restriction endonuclease S subunit